MDSQYTLKLEEIREFVAETVRLVEKSLKCLDDEPDNQNAIYNLQYGLTKDINDNRNMVNHNTRLTHEQTSAMMAVINDVDDRRRAKLQALGLEVTNYVPKRKKQEKLLY